MKSFMKCPHCEFKLTVEMRHAITAGKCPACGGTIALENAIGVLEFIQVATALKLPLSAENFRQLITTYFIGTLNLEIPEIVLEEDIADRARLAITRSVTVPEENIDPGLVQTAPSNSAREATPTRGSRTIHLTADQVKEVKMGLGVMPIAVAGNPNKIDSQTNSRVEGDKQIKFIALTKEQKQGLLRGMAVPPPSTVPVESAEDTAVEDTAAVDPIEDTVEFGTNRPVRLIPPMGRAVKSGGSTFVNSDSSAVLTPKRGGTS